MLAGVWLSTAGAKQSSERSFHACSFANMVLYGKPLADDVRKQLSTDPYLDAGTYDWRLENHDALGRRRALAL